MKNNHLLWDGGRIGQVYMLKRSQCLFGIVFSDSQHGETQPQPHVFATRLESAIELDRLSWSWQTCL